ncbi:MAG: SDR family oxidoreductase [Armatimonadetes bacterium]|nr:SDR family oxidoreductase [Armatimonadota bacterium]
MRLPGKAALVTGGGRGIGRAIALAFAAEGADVAVAARSVAQLEAVAAECRALGRHAVPVPLDVTDAAAWRRAVDAVLAELGRIDILVNNAGGGIFRWIVDMAPEEFDQVVALNLRSVFLGMHTVAPHLIERGSGRIVNVSSMAAYGGGPEYCAYSAAKAGVNLLTEVMARELKAAGRPGVTCNAICPGPVASELRSSHFPDEDPASIMQPSEVAKVAVFLSSDEASGISGAALNVRHY